MRSPRSGRMEVPMTGKERIERARAKKGLRPEGPVPQREQVMRDVKRTARSGRRHQSR
jgi:hypothetical protein